MYKGYKSSLRNQNVASISFKFVVITFGVSDILQLYQGKNFKSHIFYQVLTAWHKNLRWVLMDFTFMNLPIYLFKIEINPLISMHSLEAFKFLKAYKF